MAEFSTSEQRKDMLHLIAQYRRLVKATKDFRKEKNTDNYKMMISAEETTTKMVDDFYQKYKV